MAIQKEGGIKKLYSEKLASHYAEGDPYRPSNGTEGCMFESLWCEPCAMENYDPETNTGGCDILMRSLAFNLNDAEYPKEWIHNEYGQPCRTAFRTSMEPTLKELEDAGQTRLFPEVKA